MQFVSHDPADAVPAPGCERALPLPQHTHVHVCLCLLPGQEQSVYDIRGECLPSPPNLTQLCAVWSPPPSPPPQDNQGDLEMATERLSEYLETDVTKAAFQKLKVDVLDKSK